MKEKEVKQLFDKVQDRIVQDIRSCSRPEDFIRKGEFLGYFIQLRKKFHA